MLPYMRYHYATVRRHKGNKNIPALSTITTIIAAHSKLSCPSVSPCNASLNLSQF